MHPVYLDHAATTPLAPEVLEVMTRVLRDVPGNPSSQHAEGRAARREVDAARDALAAVLGCAHREIIFTSGGTEADNLALRGLVDRRAGDRPHIVVSAIEHDAILATATALQEAGRAEVTVVGCDARGVVSAGDVAAAVRPETVLVSVMLANNEVGTLQDVRGIAAAARVRNPDVLVHTDAVQALGKVPVRPAELGVDLLSLSGHKVYGPKGTGALWVRRGVLLDAQVTGGGHERNRRSGTENVAGIAGFAEAARLAEERREAVMPRVAELGERLVAAVRVGAPQVVVTGDGARKLPGFATFAFEGTWSEVLLTALDADGIRASGGSACSSGASQASHVLIAMGLSPAVAQGAVRFSLGTGTTGDDVQRAAEAIVRAARRALARSSAGTAAGT